MPSPVGCRSPHYIPVSRFVALSNICGVCFVLEELNTVLSTDGLTVKWCRRREPLAERRQATQHLQRAAVPCSCRDVILRRNTLFNRKLIALLAVLAMVLIIGFINAMDHGYQWFDVWNK